MAAGALEGFLNTHTNSSLGMRLNLHSLFSARYHNYVHALVATQEDSPLHHFRHLPTLDLIRDFATCMFISM